MGANMEGGAWSRRSSSNDEGKFREAYSFFQVEEMYPDQEEALKSIFKGGDIFAQNLLQTHYQT